MLSSGGEGGNKTKPMIRRRKYKTLRRIYTKSK